MEPFLLKNMGTFIPNREQDAINRNVHIPAMKRIILPVSFFFDLIQVWPLRERGKHEKDFLHHSIHHYCIH
ncbi:hypothetical protein AAHB56_21630 [Bacillus thuringiensis]